MLFLKSMGEFLCFEVKKLVIAFEKNILGRDQPRNIKIKTCVAIDMLMLLLTSLCSVMSMFLDNLTFIESFYMWFTTFTTIGFGDYKPSENFERKTWRNGGTGFFLTIRFLTALPFAIGLSLTAAILSSHVDAVDEFKAKLHKVKKQLCCSPNPIGTYDENTQPENSFGFYFQTASSESGRRKRRTNSI